MLELTVGNPFSHPAYVYVVPSQTNPLYRTYLEHSWLYLDGGETRKILVMSEYAGGEALVEPDPDVVEAFRYIPNRIDLKGVADSEHPGTDHDVQVVLGGAQIEIAEGLATYVDNLVLTDFFEILIEGEVLVQRDDSPAPQGTIFLTLDDGTGGRTNVSVPMFGNQFSAFLPPSGWTKVRAYYLPPAGTADATSAWYPHP